MRVAATTNARGQTINYGYDNADRLTTIDYPAGTPDVSRTLDDAGRPLTTTDGTGITTYTYDTGGRLTSEHRQLANATFGYRYDTLNRRSALSLTRSGGLTARNLYDYDADGRLTALTDSAGGETHFTYDPAGRPATLTHPNGVTTTNTFDPAGQLTGLATSRAATATSPASLISSYQYGYDPAGQRTSAARTNAGQPIGTSTYTYDLLGRLTGATNTDPTAPAEANATWAYDPAGNRTRQTIAGAAPTTYTYDIADQLTSDGTHTYAWDADGNLTSRRVTLTGTTVAAYTWDPANRIVSQTSSDQATTYTYDGQSRRVAKTDPTGTSTYLYDGGDLLEELNPASGGDTVETTAGGTVLNRIGLAGTTYLHADANANIGELTDQNGVALARNAYTPWGRHTTTGGAALDPYQNRHTFAGATGVRDDNSGLIDMRNRMYDPTLGTFISRDPLEATTRAAYTYASASPTNLLDPYGLEPISGGGGGSGPSISRLIGDSLLSGISGLAQAAVRNVSGYTRASGTVVAPYSRYAPGLASAYSPYISSRNLARAGRAATVATVGLGAYDAYHAYNAAYAHGGTRLDASEAAIDSVGRTAATVAGAGIGATAAGTVCSPTVVLTAVCGTGGAIVGGFVGGVAYDGVSAGARWVGDRLGGLFG